MKLYNDEAPKNVNFKSSFIPKDACVSAAGLCVCINVIQSGSVPSRGEVTSQQRPLWPQRHMTLKTFHWPLGQAPLRVVWVRVFVCTCTQICIRAVFFTFETFTQLHAVAFVSSPTVIGTARQLHACNVYSKWLHYGGFDSTCLTLQPSQACTP